MKGDPTLRYPSRFVMDLLRAIGYSISKAVWFIRYEGRENIPPNDSPPYLIVANHQSYVDPVWICLPLRRRVRYMAIGGAFTWPVIGRFIRYLGAFPVENTPAGGISAIKQSLKTLRDGAVLVVFPEGARAFAEGEFLEFKTGAVKIAAQARVPMLPVTIRGANRIWPQKQRYPKLFRRVTVTYHPLIDIAKNDKRLSDRDIEDLTQRLKDTIASENVSSSA